MRNYNNVLAFSESKTWIQQLNFATSQKTSAWKFWATSNQWKLKEMLARKFWAWLLFNKIVTMPSFLISIFAYTSCFLWSINRKCPFFWSWICGNPILTWILGRNLLSGPFHKTYHNYNYVLLSSCLLLSILRYPTVLSGCYYSSPYCWPVFIISFMSSCFWRRFEWAVSNCL